MPRAQAAEQPFVLRAAGSLEKLFRDSFKGEWLHQGAGTAIDVRACRNESESFQVVVVPFVDLKNLTWRVAGPLPAACVKVQPVGYVNVRKSNQRWVRFPKDEIRTGLWPDPLFSTWTAVSEVKANQLQPLWVTVTTPEDLAAGVHRFTITVQADGAAPATAEVALHVWDFALPDRTALRTSYWYEDRQLTGYYREYRQLDRDKQPDRDKLWALLKPFLQLYLDNRLTPVFVQWPENIVGMRYDSAAARYAFDFAEMERRLRFIFDESRLKGNCVNVLEHHYAVGFTADVVVDGVKTRKRFEPRTEEMKTFVEQYLKAWQELLGRNGWSRYAYVGYTDEPKPNCWDNVRWLHPIVKRVAPEWDTHSSIGLSVESAYSSAVGDQLDVMVPNLNYIFAQHEPFFTALQKRGKTLWGYVCGATSCIDYHAIDHRVWNWISWKYDLKGALYWAMLSLWEKPPKHRNNPAMFTTNPAERWPNRDVWDPATLRFGVPGDGQLLYPAPDGRPWSSIRLETIRDGVEDYEYFRLLRDSLDALEARGPQHARLIRRGRELLTLDETFIRNSADYSRDWRRYLTRRRNLGDLLEQTTRLLTTAK